MAALSVAVSMSIRRKLVTAVVLTVLGAMAYVAYGFVYAVRRIPEAYAAWDTGQLLVEYMKSHDNRWPSSWDDLLSVVRSNSGDQLVLYGAKAGDTNYAASLAGKVAVDWKFDPRRDSNGAPVTRLDGRRFPIAWKGAEPNAMVHRFIQASHTNAPEFR